MIKVHINPDYSKAPPQADNGGIRRVVEAQLKYLPKFGIEIVHSPNEAHVICGHGAFYREGKCPVERPGIPMVNVNHGLLWSRQPWGDGMHDINHDLVESMRRSVAWTAPSNWVNNAIRRGMCVYPETVYHGVDPEKFKPDPNPENYVLWNKLRADYVSNPEDMLELARMLEKIQFFTTTTECPTRRIEPTQNVSSIGTFAYGKMNEIIAKAGVYLSTTRETFGIGILEAMASGVPVAGWNWGGNSEIVTHGKTGFLAHPGDYKELAECVVACLSERKRLSKNCIEDVNERWLWEPRIEQYANIFKRVYERYYAKRPKVSIIVTAYKLDRFLPQCMDSVMNQTYKDFECIVVDDANLESTKIIVESFRKKDKRIRYLPTPNNFGLVGARNFGFDNSNGFYIRHLDADDYLAENALALEVDALEKNRDSDIVYGHIGLVREDGSMELQANGDPVRSGWPPDQFNWYHQMAHLNQLPSCAMVRREVFELSGGYRERMRRNEDAEFWCRTTSLGFRARKITQAVTYYHRMRDNSKGAEEWNKEGPEPDWTAWFPWRMGATNMRDARNILRDTGETIKNSYLVPFGAQGMPKPPLRFWYIHDHAYPVVSIIVTVGPGHERFLLDALDSIQAQNYTDWECFVVNDTGKPWSPNIMGAPWAKVINMEGNKGTAAARNEGFRYSSGRYIVWMDGDDFWMPWFLEKMVLYAEYNSDSVIFSDFIEMHDEKTFKAHQYHDFDPSRLSQTMQYPGSSILVPRKIADLVKYDMDAPGMEDYDWQINVHHNHFCAHRIPEPLFVYRVYSSTKREADYARIDDIREFLNRKWKKYRVDGEKFMCGCQKQITPPSKMAPKSALTSSGNFSNSTIAENYEPSKAGTKVSVEYLGDNIAPFTITPRQTRYNGNYLQYRFAQSDMHRIRDVLYEDALWLVQRSKRDGTPEYRILSVSTGVDMNNPATFLGSQIAVEAG